jgi:hypothetical protein
MERAGLRPREGAGRNASERRAGLEKLDVEADPPLTRGRPLPRESGKRLDPCGSTGVWTTACTEGSNTQHGKPRSAKGRDLHQTPARDRLGGAG